MGKTWSAADARARQTKRAPIIAEIKTSEQDEHGQPIILEFPMMPLTAKEVNDARLTIKPVDPLVKRDAAALKVYNQDNERFEREIAGVLLMMALVKAGNFADLDGTSLQKYGALCEMWENSIVMALIRFLYDHVIGKAPAIVAGATFPDGRLLVAGGAGDLAPQDDVQPVGETTAR